MLSFGGHHNSHIHSAITAITQQGIIYQIEGSIASILKTICDWF